MGEHPRWRKPADVVVCRASEPPLPAKAPPRLLPQLPPAQASSRLLPTQLTHLAPCNKTAAMPSLCGSCVPARHATGARTGEPPQPARRGAVRCAAKSCGLGRPNCDGDGGGSAGCWLLAAGELHAVVESSWLQVGAKVRLRVMEVGRVRRRREEGEMARVKI